MCRVAVRSFLLILLPQCHLGCANLAVTPPTPANDLTTAQIMEIPPPPNERYFLLVFGSQSTPKVPRLTHTWATVVRTDSVEPSPISIAETQTISWMPETLDIKTWRLRPETGKNLELHETLAWAIGTGQRVSMWGPFEIHPVLYRRFLMQKEFLESGAIGYQCIDTIGEAARKGNGSDCYHAITDMDAQYDRGRYPLSKYGEAASQKVVSEIISRGAVANPEITHDWILDQLSLRKYPLVRRTAPVTRR